MRIRFKMPRHSSRLTAAAVALLASPAPAVAACVQWDASGASLVLEQSNGARIRFDLVQQGENVSGRASYLQREAGTKILGLLVQGEDIYTISGIVEGSLKGSIGSLRVRWDKALGVYEFRIDADGRFEGETYDFYAPHNRAKIISAERLPCLRQAEAAPAPQPRRLGKSAPSRPPAPVAVRPESAPILSERPPSQAVVGRGPSLTRLPSPVAVGTSAGAPISFEAASAPPNGCAQGHVRREAGPDDRVCVTSASRSRAAQENARASTLWDPDGAYGPYSCVSGYVWREAFAGDNVCVTPAIREVVRAENRAGRAP